MARKGLVSIIDIDNLAFAKENGMPIPRTLNVKSPSGGYHLYLYATAKSDKLGNCDVLGPDGKPAVEFKSHNKTVAAPGTWRDDKEPYGWYPDFLDVSSSDSQLAALSRRDEGPIKVIRGIVHG